MPVTWYRLLLICTRIVCDILDLSGSTSSTNIFSEFSFPSPEKLLSLSRSLSLSLSLSRTLVFFSPLPYPSPPLARHIPRALHNTIHSAEHNTVHRAVHSATHRTVHRTHCISHYTSRSIVHQTCAARGAQRQTVGMGVWGGRGGVTEGEW